MPACPLEGRVALVTGASSGIGEATALALAQAGAKVAIAARRRERLEWLAERIGGETLVLEADLARVDEAMRIVRETERRFGRLDILINNAGVMYLEPVAEADLGRWRHMLELNVLSLIASSQAALPGMRGRKDGHIVNISSTAGRVANPNGAGYSATKFGVVAFSEALRKELVKDRVRVTVIEPGIVETELRDHVAHAGSKAFIDQFAATVRQLQPQDVANAILYAVSQPPHVCINEILMRPTDQERYSGPEPARRRGRNDDRASTAIPPARGGEGDREAVEGGRLDALSVECGVKLRSIEPRGVTNAGEETNERTVRNDLWVRQSTWRGGESAPHARRASPKSAVLRVHGDADLGRIAQQAADRSLIPPCAGAPVVSRA